MTYNELINLYSDRKDTYQKQIQILKKKTTTTSWLRVVVALSILLLAYFSVKLILLAWTLIPLIILFAFLVNRQQKMNRDKKHLENMTEINKSEIKALQGDHASFEDGAGFIDPLHAYSLDLDIFGKGSLFQRVNRTCTEPGKERLAQMLTTPLNTVKDIIEKQQAIRELSSLLDFRQHFQATGMSSRERKEDQQQLLAWLTLPSIVYGKQLFKTLLMTAPVLSIASIVVALVSGLHAPFIVIALIQWTIIGMYAKRVMLFQDYIGSKRFLLEKFTAHFLLLNDQKFSSTLLKDIHDHSHVAREQLHILASRSRALDLRLNIFANILLNTTVLYDLQCVYRLEQWREQNRQHLEKWLRAVQEADALNSFATFRFNNPGFVFPEITTEHVLEATELGHPLIPLAQRINNTVVMNTDSLLWIVTGANMAGKSTFLRTVGINSVLALTGSVVCAKRMTCTINEIHTGMRNTDSINDNQSYFFAELLRLKKIINQLKSGKRMLILLDEILKGTNSTDKLTGSKALVRKLISYPCFAIVATHDIALGDLEAEHPTSVKNYHFETFIKGEDLSFDYKLKPGVSTGKNATFLMRKMEIIDREL